MDKHYKIKQGLDIKIKGVAEKIIKGDINSEFYVICPKDFFGFSPKLNVEINDIIKQGECICFDKKNPEIKLTSPVSGKILEINRGEKRSINEIIIKKIDNEIPKTFEIPSLELLNKEKIQEILLESGVWLYLKQRPFGTIANPKIIPSDIFISFFDSSPLAGNYDFILQNYSNEINYALKIISFLSNNKLKLNFREKSSLYEFIEEKDKYEISFFEGPHPAGLHGTHINKISPINKGDIIWTINAIDLPIIGNLFIKKMYIPERIFALCGSEITDPAYYRCMANSVLDDFLKDKVMSDDCRYISGNVLTGKNVSNYSYLNFFDASFCVIPEGGNDNDMFGWLAPGLNKYSNSKTFLSNYLPVLKFLKNIANDDTTKLEDNYRISTNMHGGKRAFIVSGEYEKVCPLNIYPQFLIKSAIANDIEKLEKLGIYEILEEDLALCEFVCSSKINVQEIIKNTFISFLNEN